MKALREAKAYLAEWEAAGVEIPRGDSAEKLANLVAEIEAAPVVEADEDSMVFVILAPDMAGQRVRVLAVGEDEP